MILFHHRAETDCRGWTRTNIRVPQARERGPTIRRPGIYNEGWWPARVTRPVLRIKSPLHHFNACRPQEVTNEKRHTSGWSLSPTGTVKISWSQYSPSHDRGRSSCFAFGGVKMVRASGNAPEPGTRPVRCGL
jgi:hypothetical protein